MKNRIKVSVTGRTKDEILGFAEIQHVIITGDNSVQADVVETKKKYFKVDKINNKYEVEAGVSVSDAYTIGFILEEMEGKSYFLSYNSGI